MNSKLLQPLKDFSVTFIIIFIICSTLINAQEVVDLNGKQFIKSGGEWYQLYSEKRFKVDKKVITVKFKSTSTPNEIVKLNTQFNVKVLRESILGFIDVEIPSSADPIEMVKAYLNNSLVEIAEVNTYGEYLGTPNDLYFANQWYLYQISDADIDVTEAWNIESGKPSQVISIIDSGTDWTHEDLGFGTDSYQNIWLNPGEDTWSDPNDPSTGNGIDDDYNGYIDDWKGWYFGLDTNDSRGVISHGTQVSGIASAKTNNSKGIAGVAGGWGAAGAKLMTLGVGYYAPNSSVLDDAILYACSNGANVIQMSLSAAQSSAIDAALQTAYQTYNCFVVCAAGNDNGPVSYPANNQYVVAVGATDRNDVRANFSNYGPTLDVVAPGVEIYSTAIDNTYVYGSGTSFAAPQVSALGALLLSINSNLTNAQIESIIEQTSEDKGAPGLDNYYGYGRINAYEALKYTIENYGGTFNQDVIIPSGDSWTLEPGVTLSFENGSSLVVNGHLQINGTSGSNVVFDFGSPNSTTQNGIKINPGATITATYTNIQNAYRGIYFDESYGTVNYCTFEDCTEGLRFYRTNYAAQQPNLNYNTVFKNSYDGSGTGIACSYSSPYMTNNEVYNYYTGIGVIYNSSPQLGYSSAQGQNNLHNNYKNLHAISSSNPFLGSTGLGSYSGYNKLTNASYLNILAQTNCNILAEINWWGSSDQQTIESTISTSSSTVDFIPFLNSSPFRAVIDPGLTQALNKTTNENSELFKAQEFIIGKEYEKSLQIINKYKNSIDLNEALFTFDLILQLKRAMQEDGLSFDEEHHLNSIKELNKNKTVAGLIDLYLAGKMRKNFTSIEEIKNNYKQESEVVTAALFTEFMINFNELNDYVSAKNILIAAYHRNNEHPLVEAATELLEDVYPNIRIELPKSAPGANEITKQVTEYALFANYPNPFNPETSISYNIPEVSHVKIELVDISGRVIKTFEQGLQSQGIYKLMWDGNNSEGINVASGVYLYRIVAVSAETGKSFTASKKMILLR